MENLLKNLEILREKILLNWSLLDIDGQKQELADLKREMSSEDFWNDHNKAVEVGRKVEELESEIGSWEDILNEVTDLEQFVAVAAREGDMSIEDDSCQQYEELKDSFDDLEFFVLFSGKYDKGNVIISIHAGAGGVDAQDWAMMLERMYLRFFDSKEWKAEVVDRTVGNEAGIKSVTISVSGRWAYGNLRGEAGVHRLVRISPFDGDGMRHTSFASVEVIPELPEAEEVVLQDNEIRIDVYKSSGPGGQGVNTTDSAVRIVHLASNISVSCQRERSQHQNKETALKILKAKLFKIEEEKRLVLEAKLKGVVQKAEWGKQIRSYVLQPYKMVKDHRTEMETQLVEKVLDGELSEFIEAYLKWSMVK